MEEAHALGQICKDFPNCHVNLIPVNGNEHIELYKPSITNMNTFKDIVGSYGCICNGYERKWAMQSKPHVGN